MGVRDCEVPEILTALEELVRDSILKQGLSTEAANEIAFEAVGEIAKRFGGEEVYFPKGILLSMARRNKQIFKELDNGASIKSLARKYSVSERRILQIIESRQS